MGRLKAAVLTGGFCLAAVHVSLGAGGPQEARPAGPLGIVIHGGEGVKPRSEMTPEVEREYRKALEQAVLAGWEVLRDGGTSVSAVEAAIRVMEDSPLFNAGKGASFNRAGFNELDAAIMDGATLKAGAVAVVRRVRNPISLARLVMERSPHVLMAAEGAENFALDQGMSLVPPSYFFTEHKWRSLQLRLQQETPYRTETGHQAPVGPRPRAVRDRGRGCPRPRRERGGRHVDRRSGGKTAGESRRFADSRRRHLRLQRVARGVVHGARRVPYSGWAVRRKLRTTW